MPKLATLIIALLAVAACKKEPKPAAKVETPPAAAPAAQNAVTQHASEMKATLDKAKDVQQKANAAIGQNTQAIDEATSAQ